METRVDVLIPSKDRVSQLHLLLESMDRCLKNVGKVTISYQASTDDFLRGYQLLQQRVYNDAKFEILRENTTEIVFRQRDSLSDVIKVIDDLGESDYVMPLVDDEIFHQPYDFGKAESFKYFREHKDVLACCLRLGDNICKSSDPHRNVAIIEEKPVLKTKDESMLTWDWSENLTIVSWSALCSVTGHVYRKKLFIEWFRRFGRESFLHIEGRAKENLIAGIYRVPRFIVRSINYLNRIQMGILRRTIGVEGRKNIKQLFWEELFYRRKPAPRDGIPTMMTAPRHSVCYNLELNNSVNRGLNLEILAEFNEQYLHGDVLDYNYYAGLEFYYVILVCTGPAKFITY